jgi:hypothetical protein
MEWQYTFDDTENTIDKFILIWKTNIEILKANQQKTVVVMDITKTNMFSVSKILKIISFISSNRRKLSETTDKVRIVVATSKQERNIKTALGISPVRICEFEIIKNIADV